MSQLIEVLAKIDSSGGTVVVRDQEVRLRVRPGTLSEADREILAQHRDDVIAMLARDQDQAGVEVVEDLDAWLAENTIEPTPCDQCGGLERWEDLAGGWHCAKCDPPLTAQRLRERAERLRRDTPDHKPSWPIDGADEVLALTPDDLPTAPWRSGTLACFDNERLLNELRIDLQVIGKGGVNHRSGRLRRDVAAILEARRRQYASVS